MSQTVIQRDALSSAATFTSGAPGNLGTVSGTFYRHAVGPRLTADTTAWGTLHVGSTATTATEDAP